MKKTVGCIASLSLAFSLFAMPAMASTPDAAASEEQSAIQELQESSPESSQADYIPVFHPVANLSQDPSADGSEAPDSSPAADGAETPEDSAGSQDEAQPSFLESLLGMFTGISPFSISPESMTGASLEVSLRSLVPSASAGSVSSLKVELSGKNGEGHYSGTFSADSRSAEPVVSDVHNASKEAVVTVLSTTEYTARVQDIQPGTYSVTVSGGNFGSYTHGQDVTLRNGDMATFQLVDCMYTEPIPQDDPYTGFLPYGDFNHDGKVDSADSAIICKALDDDASDTAYDLSSDGAFTLVDIQLFTSNMERTHQASDTRIVKDVSQMKAQFAEGTQASIPGKPSASQEDAANSLFFDDGDSVSLARQEGANVSSATPVGVSIDALGTDLAAFVIQFPKDEANNAVFMGDAGTLTVVLADPQAKDDADSDYTIYADIKVVDESQSDIATLAEDEGHPFDPMYDTLKAKLYKSTGQLVVIFDPAVAPVNLRSVLAEFTSTTDPSGKAVRIDHVEFLNSLEDLILPQQLSAPELQLLSADDGTIEVGWDTCEGAASYDIELVSENSTDLISTAANSMLLTSHSSTGDLQNGVPYLLRARSVGLRGASGWSAPVVTTPEDRTPPDTPQGTAAVAGYSQVQVSWEAVAGAQSYIVFYKDAQSEGAYSSVATADTQAVLSGLQNPATYLLYVVAENAYGQSLPTDTVEVSTESAGAKVPWYNLINRTSQNPAAHPVSEELSFVSVSGLDSEQSLAVVDGNFDTYVDLGDGNAESAKSVTVGFNSPQNIRNFAISTYMGEGFADNVDDIYVRAFAENGTDVYSTGTLDCESGVTWRSVPAGSDSDSLARNTVYVTLPAELKGVSSLNIGFSRSSGVATVSELAFYWPDGLADRVNDLWTDATHTSLMDSVDAQALDSLQDAVNTPDVYSAEGDRAAEFHPFKDELLAQISAAHEILEASDAITVGVDSSMLSAESAVNGTNAWQPLGVSACAGQKVKIYVGTPDDITGQPTKLKLVASQYRGGTDAQFTSVGYLMSGMNEITVPLVGNQSDASLPERGGSLYVEYTGSFSDSEYSLTVIGGTPIPVLDLRGLDNAGVASGVIEGSAEDALQASDERSRRIAEYLKALEQHVNTLSSAHGSAGHTGTGFLGWFASDTCTANVTEIVTDYALLSIPATQVLMSLSEADSDAQISKVSNALSTIDSQIALVYQQCGFFSTSSNPRLTSEFGASNDVAHAQANIRCLELPDTLAYMPLSNCMGISWDALYDIWNDAAASDAGFLEADFAHALGHQVAQNAYTDPEAFADYISMLSCSDEDGASVIDWDSVLRRVTSGVKGVIRSQEALACYWQLHLAYDSQASGTVYSDPDKWMYGNIFARMASYSRNPSAAPYGLRLDDTDSDNTLMRLAVAASGHNILDFFRAWGFEPNAATVEYASNFARETRSIHFITDDARALMDADGSYTLGLPEGFEVRTFADMERVTEDGVPNFSMLAEKDGWEISTNMLPEGQEASSEQSSDAYAKAALPICAAYDDTDASAAVDATRSTVFSGNVTADGGAQQVTIALNCVADISGIRYAPGLKEKSFNGVTVEVSENGRDWIKVAETALYFPSSADYKGYDAYGGSSDATIIFTADATSGSPDDRSKLATYKASYVRLTEWCESASAVSIAEIDIVCNPQYSATFLDESQHYGIGKLTHQLVLESDSSYTSNDRKIVIPQGSFVIMGDYSGDPVYNTVVLRDGSGNLIADPSDQIIILHGATGSDVSIVSSAATVRTGTWLYYFEPGSYEDLLDGWHGVHPELYRVDESATLTGAQLVYSDHPVEIPRQDINDDIDVDLFGVQLDFGAYRVQS